MYELTKIKTPQKKTQVGVPKAENLKSQQKTE